MIFEENIPKYHLNISYFKLVIPQKIVNAGTLELIGVVFKKIGFVA